MKEELLKKVDQSLNLLQSCSRSAGEPLEIAYSGGKDSDVILELAKMAGVEFRAIYKNTTIDPPGTIKHVMENSVEIRRPKETFFQLMSEHGYFSRRHRVCCDELKEYKISNNVVMGIRCCESAKRDALNIEPTSCIFYGSRKIHANGIYPILDWSDEDELEFIQERNIKLHPLYYREDGTIDITRRLGCICCPLVSNRKRKIAFHENPKFLRLWLRMGGVFLRTHPDSSAASRFADSYEWLYSEMNYKAWKNWKTGFFCNDRPDFKKLLSEQLQVQL